MKLKKSLILLISGALLTISSSCSKKELKENPQDNSGGLKFLKVGHEWTYNYTAVDVKEIVKYKILSKDSKGNLKVNWFMGHDFEIYWHEQEGAFSFASEGPDGLKLVLYKENCKIGDSWSVKEIDENGAEVTETNKVISVSESVTTPAGTFTNCVKVHNTNNSDNKIYMDFYIHPQYGIVKMDGVGFLEAEGPRTYFPFLYLLKTKNF